MDKSEKKELEDKIIAALKEIYDPEIPVDIFELGLIYEVKIKQDGNVEIDMTLTSPNCPVAESLPVDVKNKVELIEEVSEAKINIVFDPPWDKDMMSEEAQLELGFL
ncbi:SUF system Fe-S cluster assembly protein [Paracrocinitomix mangrovi]|uniref:SUF system Fe-S cluster assembly protein n=1 Tax=Paracrocinitomix mangrovi TaxID=2862509 RepID=UPI001C8E542C|nr:SUF system Fe-S cluster assembly protein [Paracrocinitomix mangrovi]UKN03870.1 SUF system Fe-S cluster assembly protein [Paracrocinitomix mangrovi]